MSELTAIISETHIIVVRTEAGIRRTVVSEVRPESFAAAETMLAWNSFGLVGSWELSPSGVRAELRQLDNVFNGTVAARLDQAVGYTHEDFRMARACEVENGDLISDMELSGVAVVAGCSTDSLDATYIHQVTEGKTWQERYTGTFMARQLVMRAKKL